MKTQVTITEITQEDLVNLFSTALYNSGRFTADVDESIEYDEEDSIEDIFARILLNGGKINVTDHYAEGAVYGDLQCYADNGEEEYVTYFVTLEDVKIGLERAASGTFKAGENDDFMPDWRDRNISFAWRSFNAFANDESEWDWVTADCLMQIILFNEIVYG